MIRILNNITKRFALSEKFCPDLLRGQTQRGKGGKGTKGAKDNEFVVRDCGFIL